jgi:uncharacterized protein involved in exopolysaccharide biosynthesis
MTVARTNFSEILQSREVYDRTARQLGLSGEDTNYKVDVRSLHDSDFFIVAVQSRNAGLVGQIVNVHVNEAIAYYGEVRAKPTVAIKSFLAEQVAQADQRVRAAESAIADFQAQNKVTNVTADIASNQKVIDDLISVRNQRILLAVSGTVTGAARMDQVTATGPVDTLITQYRNEITRLLALQPRYSALQDGLDQARSDYQRLVDKYNLAVQVEQSAQAASFLQVIEPGTTPAEPVSSRLGVVIPLALLAGLVVGVVLAFVLDWLFPHTIKRPQDKRGHRQVDVAQPLGESLRH